MKYLKVTLKYIDLMREFYDIYKLETYLNSVPLRFSWTNVFVNMRLGTKVSSFFVEGDLMFEYDVDTILRILKIEEFELDKLNLNQIKHVPMHQYRISSSEKPLLLIENLQVCIGLYAYSKLFGFAAHLNPVVRLGDEFQCDENKNITYCNRVDDLFNAIIGAKVQEPVYIGISIGFNPVEKTYQAVDILNKSVDNLIIKLNTMGIDATKLDIKDNHIFILDTIRGEIITPSTQNIKETIKTK